MAAIDEILATIRRLPLPERLKLIERATLEAAEDTPRPAAVAQCPRSLSLDEVVAARLTPAVAEGAGGRGTATGDSLIPRLAGRINADLERGGRIIGMPDVFIAAIALRHGLPIVTGNVAHFEQVRSAGYELCIDNWRAT